MVRVLEAKGVWKVYETAATRVEALRDVSVKINQGEMVAVMGPSGPSPPRRTRRSDPDTPPPRAPNTWCSR